MSNLIATRVSSDSPLAPGDTAWQDATEVTFSLEPTPVDSQPSAYVQTSWADKTRGDVGSLTARALASDTLLMLRLEWEVDEASPAVTDYNVYADACGVLLPTNGEADLTTMGSVDAPVTAWFWRAGQSEPTVLNATGLGTTRPADEQQLQVNAELSGNTWTVVFTHPLPTGTDSMPIGFAVWAGAADERAGLKSHTPEWQALKIA